MNNEKENIEIPFGAFDSELGGWEYTIPEGFEAEIKDGKVIVRKSESEDEKVRKSLLAYVKGESNYLDIKKWVAYLEKQGEQKQEWSEEDEEAIDIAIKSLEELDEGCRFCGYTMTSHEAANRLKSLKEKCCPQNGDYHEGFKRSFDKAKGWIAF